MACVSLTVTRQMACDGDRVSHRAVAHVLEFPGPWSPTARHVAAVIAAHVSDEDGTCWPSDARLSTLTGLAPRTVKRAVTELEAAGALDRRTGAFRAGGRRRVITWLHWPIGPRLVVDNSTGTEDPKRHTGTSEGPHRHLAEGPHRHLEPVRNHP